MGDDLGDCLRNPEGDGHYLDGGCRCGMENMGLEEFRRLNLQSQCVEVGMGGVKGGTRDYELGN